MRKNKLWRKSWQTDGSWLLLRICDTLVHHSSILCSSWKCGWFCTNFHYYKQITCVGNQTVDIFDQTDGSSCCWESVTHWCTILLFSAHPESVAGSAQTFTTTNKSPVKVIKQLTSLTKLMDPDAVENLWHIGAPFFYSLLILKVWLVLHKLSLLQTNHLCR